MMPRLVKTSSGWALHWASWASAKQALDMYMAGYELSLKYPGNSHIHPEPLSFEIGELFAKLGDKEKAREWMLKSEEYKGK